VALHWTTSARSDLVRLHEFLEPINRRAAAQAVRQLVAGAKRIPPRPRLGQRLREFAPRERGRTRPLRCALWTTRLSTAAMNLRPWTAALRAVRELPTAWVAAGAHQFLIENADSGLRPDSQFWQYVVSIKRGPVHCGGKLRIIAAIEDPALIVAILTHLGLPPRAPPRSPARNLPLLQAA